MRYGIGFSIASLVLYTLVMSGVRAYAHRIGLIGGWLTIAGMYIAAYWYERRQDQKEVEILPPEANDEHLR